MEDDVVVVDDIKEFHVLVAPYPLIIVNRKPFREAGTLLQENFVHQGEVLVERAIFEIIMLYTKEPVNIHQDRLYY